MSQEPESSTPRQSVSGQHGDGESSDRSQGRAGNPPQPASRRSFKVGNSSSAGEVLGDTPVGIDTQPVAPGPENSPLAPLPGPSIKRGTRPGDRYVRVVRHNQPEIQRIPTQLVQLSEESLTSNPNMWRRLKGLLIGQPIATARSHQERLSKVKALAIFASDALSSVAYATEATLFVLVTVVMSQQPLQYVIPISILICVLIGLVVNSYRQTVHAYPGGGGSYIVSKDNLGTNAGLVAAAAILIDYTLTVAVSVSAGVLAITSAFPVLNGYQVEIGVGVIFLLTLANLRGIRESGNIFTLPTYIFIVSFLALLLVGLFRYVTGDFTPIAQIKDATREIPDYNTHPLTIFLLMQAFAAGCSALTGVEAISDGVQAFKKPESRNAAITLLAMGGLLIVFFMGTSFLAYQLNAMPDEANASNYETVISKIGRAMVGGDSFFYYLVQFSTSLILLLAANTAFADFPRLSYFLARDKFMPNIFSYRGDRLAYTTGIIVLAVLAAILLAVFNGHTESLIPLYAVGVFLAFTLSQSGMVMHWQKKKREGIPGVTRSQLFNLLGAIATGIVLVIIILTKFTQGAWLVVLLIPLLFMLFKAINRHYRQVTEQLRVPTDARLDETAAQLPVNGTRKRTVLVPISRLNKVAFSTLDFARALSDDVTALFINDEPAAIEGMTQRWQSHVINIPLTILENPFRSIIPPLLNYIEEIDSKDPDDVIVIVLPEFVARHWWERILHNRTADRIKQALLYRPGVVVVDVPYHLERSPAKTIAE